MLRDVPHFVLGHVVSRHHVVIYILFPHMPVEHSRFVALINQQLACWLDKIFYPAVYEYLEPGYTQHLLGDFDYALANVRAH